MRNGFYQAHGSTGIVSSITAYCILFNICVLKFAIAPPSFQSILQVVPTGTKSKSSSSLDSRNDEPTIRNIKSSKMKRQQPQ